MLKRAFDLLAAGAGLALLSPFMVLIAVLVKLDSEGPAFFRQERVGRGFRRFWILKFRTMARDGESRGRQITSGDDARVTRLGRFLRAAKLDELPQLVNVLKGEMSLVGPRPEVPRYVELFKEDFAEILSVRPGITDLASLKYRDEAGLLGRAADPEEEYVRRVLPEKIRLAKEYVGRSSLPFDLGIIFRTLRVLIGACQIS